MEVFRFGQCFGGIFSPIAIFLNPGCFCTFSDAANSRFWCGDPKHCLPDFLKMLGLALSQIYTRSYFWNNLSEFDSLFNQHDHSAAISSSILGQTGFGPGFLHSPHHAASSLVFFFALVSICTGLECRKTSLNGNTGYAGYLTTH